MLTKLQQCLAVFFGALLASSLVSLVQLAPFWPRVALWTWMAGAALWWFLHIRSKIKRDHAEFENWRERVEAQTQGNARTLAQLQTKTGTGVGGFGSWAEWQEYYLAEFGRRSAQASSAPDQPDPNTTLGPPHG